MRSAFSLIEILLSLGIIAILATIVLVAINPTKHLGDARAQDRNISMREIENAISQYYIDGNTLSGIPQNKATAQPICQNSASSGDCSVAGGYNLSVLVPDYFTSIPIDPNETGDVLTGYRIYRFQDFIKICSPVLDSDCGS